VQEISSRHELVEHFALFLERLPMLGKVTKFELRCRSYVGSQLRFEILPGASDIGDRKAPKMVDKTQRVGSRAFIGELFVDRVGRERERTT
jgi:hypothetical protein